MAIPTVTPYKMSEIKSKLLQPALTSHFICQFSPPLEAANFIKNRSVAGFIGSENNKINQELIQISCAEASLPGSTLATNEINNDFTGVTERHAYRRIYDDRADFTFYVDKEYRIIDFFENWISYIVGEDSVQDQRNRSYNYRVNFPNLYKSDNLNITKFEKDYSGRVLSYDFINAYPISINSMPVSYDTSQLLKCTVSFTYSRYVISRAIGKVSKPLTSKGNTNSPDDSEINRPTLARLAEQNPSLTYNQRVLEGDEVIDAINYYRQPI
jgi:hypothetical protein